MTGKTNAWIAMVIVITVGFTCGKLWQQFHQKSVLGSNIIAQNVSDGGEGSGEELNKGNIIDRPTIQPVVPLPTTPPLENPPISVVPIEPIVISPNDGTPALPIDPGTDIDVDIVDPSTGNPISVPAQPAPTNTPSTPSNPSNPSDPGIIPISPAPTSTPISNTIAAFLQSAVQSLSLSAPSDESLTVYIDKADLSSETTQALFAQFPLVSIEQVNVGGVTKVKLVVHARFADGTRIPIKDDILDIIKKRLALYQISVGLMGERVFYVEHGSIDQNPARAVTRYPLSFNLVHNRVQVVTPVGLQAINSLPDQTAQYVLDTNHMSSIDMTNPFRLTATNGELTYIIRGKSCQHFVGLIPVCFGRIVTASAVRTGNNIRIHQSLLSKIIDAGSL